MASPKVLVLIAIVLLIVIIAFVYYFVNLRRSSLPPTFAATLLDTKPTLSGQFIKNPDIVYPSSGWLSATPENLATGDTVLNVSSDWEGDAWIDWGITPLGGRLGGAGIGPFNSSCSCGRHLEQSTYLPAGDKYMLYLGIVDAADMLQALCNITKNCTSGTGNFSGSCADVGFRVTIFDNTKNKVYTVFNKTIRNSRWYDYSIDLESTFSGDSITARVEGYAADAGCGLWNGEWATVDYLSIVKV